MGSYNPRPCLKAPDRQQRFAPSVEASSSTPLPVASVQELFSLGFRVEVIAAPLHAQYPERLAEWRALAFESCAAGEGEIKHDSKPWERSAASEP